MHFKSPRHLKKSGDPARAEQLADIARMIEQIDCQLLLGRSGRLVKPEAQQAVELFKPFGVIDQDDFVSRSVIEIDRSSSYDFGAAFRRLR